MAFSPDELDDDALEFLSRPRALASLATVRDGRRPHVATVGFTYDHPTRSVRVVTMPGSQKTRNVERGSRALVNQIDGMIWLQLEGDARVVDDPGEVADAYERFARRYGRVHEGESLVVIAVQVDLCRSPQDRWGRRAP